MSTPRVTKGDVQFKAELLASEMSATDSPAVTVQHGNWSGYHIATVVTFTWTDGHTESMSLTGTKREVARSLTAALKALLIANTNNTREA